MRVKNISPLGTGRILPGLDDLYVPIGGVIDVDDDFGCLLCEQVDVWAPDDERSIDLFVRFCQWIAAVKEAEAKAAAEAKAEEEAPKPSFTNPALERFAQLANGGIVPSPGLFIVGDGTPETVQLPDGTFVLPTQTPKPAARRRDAAAAADKDGE